MDTSEELFGRFSADSVSSSEITEHIGNSTTPAAYATHAPVQARTRMADNEYR